MTDLGEHIVNLDYTMDDTRRDSSDYESADIPNRKETNSSMPCRTGNISTLILIFLHVDLIVCLI